VFISCESREGRYEDHRHLVSESKSVKILAFYLYIDLMRASDVIMQRVIAFFLFRHDMPTI